MSYTVTGFLVFMFSMILGRWPCIIKTISLGGHEVWCGACRVSLGCELFGWIKAVWFGMFSQSDINYGKGVCELVQERE